MKELLVFIISLLIPLLLYRGVFILSRNYTSKTIVRQKTSLNFHHSHYGIILIFIAFLIMFFFERSLFSLILFGLGFGAIFDEFTPLLLMKTNRKIELDVYRRSFKSTLILFIFIIILLMALYFITRYSQNLLV